MYRERKLFESEDEIHKKRNAENPGEEHAPHLSVRTTGYFLQF